jgi:hypothetical protein
MFFFTYVCVKLLSLAWIEMSFKNQRMNNLHAINNNNNNIIMIISSHLIGETT